jgi:hypothetical protein
MPGSARDQLPRASLFLGGQRQSTVLSMCDQSVSWFREDAQAPLTALSSSFPLPESDFLVFPRVPTSLQAQHQVDGVNAPLRLTYDSANPFLLEALRICQHDTNGAGAGARTQAPPCHQPPGRNSQ